MQCKNRLVIYMLFQDLLIEALLIVVSCFKYFAVKLRMPYAATIFLNDYTVALR